MREGEENGMEEHEIGKFDIKINSEREKKMRYRWIDEWKETNT